jgi:hypothetical protein
VYPPPPPKSGGLFASLAMKAATSAAAGLAVASSSAAAGIAKLDERYELSATASRKAAELGSTARQKAADLGSRASQGSSDALRTLKAAAAHKVSASTPEERQRWAEGAVTVISLATAFGGRKTRALAGMASFAMATASQQGSGVQPVSQTQERSNASEHRAIDAPAEQIIELIQLEVVATAPAGAVMQILVEGMGSYEVVVPEGVRPGETFYFELEAPLGESTGVAAAVQLGVAVDAAPAAPYGHLIDGPAVPFAD